MNWSAETSATLGEERERLAQQHSRVQEVAEAGDVDTEAAGFSANEISQMGAAVDYLIRGDEADASIATGESFEGYGADATVTVQGLSTGLYARVTDRVDTIRAQRDDIESARGVHRNVFAAAGLVDAPFVDLDEAAAAISPPGSDRGYDDLAPGDQLDARLRAVTNLPPNVTKWLYDVVDRQTGVGTGNWKPSSEPRTETTPEA